MTRIKELTETAKAPNGFDVKLDEEDLSREYIDPYDKPAAEPTEINDILNERRRTHGEYSSHACYAWGIKNICHNSPNWQRLSYHQKETLDMIAHKLARILAGDPHYDDHWKDIAGYAKLTADRL